MIRIENIKCIRSNQNYSMHNLIFSMILVQSKIRFAVWKAILTWFLLNISVNLILKTNQKVFFFNKFFLNEVFAIKLAEMNNDT